jgi:hypothetical protein
VITISGFDYGLTGSGTDGTYSLQLASAEARDSICVFVFAQPPGGTNELGESDTTLVVLNFGAAQTDSVRVDPVLRPL